MSCAIDVSEYKASDPGVAGLVRLLQELDAVAQRNPRALAAIRDPHLLAFLAEQGAPATRRAVAANRAASTDTDVQLSADWDEAVRAEIACKIGWRLSGTDVSPEVLAILAFLSEDSSICVRATLAQELRYLCGVPREIVHRLMSDFQVDVLSPLIDCSPLVTDAELIAAVSRMADAEVLLHVARRRPLSANVADAVVMFLEPKSLSALLENPEAEIRTESLDHIAGCADIVASCLDALAKRTDLSPWAEQAIAVVAGPDFRERQSEPSTGLARLEVETAKQDGALDDAFIRDAAMDGDVERIIEGLALLGDLRASAVRTVLASGSKRGVVALVRRAGLNMRTAYRVLGAATRHGKGAKESRGLAS